MNDSGIDDDGHVRQSEWQRLLEEYKPVAWIVVGSVLVFFLVLGLIPHVLACIGIVGEAGTFGDSFGFVNAFFSGFAVAGLLVTIWIQIREFHLAQLERKDSIETQKKTSVQQYFTGLVTAISTWTDLHGDTLLPGYGQMDLQHFKYLERKQSNEVLLDLASDYLLSEAINEGDRNIIGQFQKDPMRLMLMRDQADARSVVKVALEELSLAWHLLQKVPHDATVEVTWLRGILNGAVTTASQRFQNIATAIRNRGEETTVCKLCDELCKKIEETKSKVNRSNAFTGTTLNLQVESQKALNHIREGIEIVISLIVYWYSNGYPTVKYERVQNYDFKP